jgi:hypothetical protein
MYLQHIVTTMTNRETIKDFDSSTEATQKKKVVCWSGLINQVLSYRWK